MLPLSTHGKFPFARGLRQHQHQSEAALARPEWPFKNFLSPNPPPLPPTPKATGAFCLESVPSAPILSCRSTLRPFDGAQEDAVWHNQFEARPTTGDYFAGPRGCLNLSLVCLCASALARCMESWRACVLASLRACKLASLRFCAFARLHACTLARSRLCASQ
jgi:hypothetical protein